MKRSPIVIGVAGCSGSGKTSLAEELARELEGTHFHLDHYYRDLSHLAPEERDRQNFDDPDMLESKLLMNHIRQLKEGEAIYHPQYDFATHTRVPGATTRLEVDHLLVIDGIFALHYEGLRQLYDLSVYVDAPDEICYRRRLTRDVRDRGRTAENVTEHYTDTVRPMAEEYVRPSAKYADLIVNGTESLDWSVEQVLSALSQRGLLTILGAS
jgi:uridine kinase